MDTILLVSLVLLGKFVSNYLERMNVFLYVHLKNENRPRTWTKCFILPLNESQGKIRTSLCRSYLTRQREKMSNGFLELRVSLDPAWPLIPHVWYWKSHQVKVLTIFSSCTWTSLQRIYYYVVIQNKQFRRTNIMYIPYLRNYGRF